MVAKKDFNAPKHEELEVPNLEVIKALQSLTSKGYVKTQFSWQWYYYVLTPEGVEYLREWCVSTLIMLRAPSSYSLLRFCVVLCLNTFAGCTSLRKSSPKHTASPFVLVPPRSALVEATVPTAHPVATVTTTAVVTMVERRRVRLESIGLSSLVSAVVLPGSKRLTLWTLSFLLPLFRNGASGTARV